jgi:hypothetical protein
LLQHDPRVLGSLGAAEKWARCPDRTKATEPGRRAADERFERQALELFGDLPPEELAFRVKHLRRAHFLRMQIKSTASKRAKNKAVDATDGRPEQARAVKTTSDAADALASG